MVFNKSDLIIYVYFENIDFLLKNLFDLYGIYLVNLWIIEFLYVYLLLYIVIWMDYDIVFSKFWYYGKFNFLVRLMLIIE